MGRFGRGLAAGLALLALAACSRETEAGYNARLARFVGTPEARLVAELGVPVRSYESGGQRFLQYEEQRVVTYPGYAFPSAGRYPWAGPVVSGPLITTRSCAVTFALREGRVESYTFRGNDCVAVPPAG